MNNIKTFVSQLTSLLIALVTGTAVIAITLLLPAYLVSQSAFWLFLAIPMECLGWYLLYKLGEAVKTIFY